MSNQKIMMDGNSTIVTAAIEELAIDKWNRAIRRRSSEEFNYYEKDNDYVGRLNSWASDLRWSA
jgi:hypothetical protein